MDFGAFFSNIHIIKTRFYKSAQDKFVLIKNPKIELGNNFSHVLTLFEGVLTKIGEILPHCYHPNTGRVHHSFKMAKSTSTGYFEIPKYTENWVQIPKSTAKFWPNPQSTEKPTPLCSCCQHGRL